MSDEVLDIYDLTLAEQLGQNGVFTTSAVYDPDGSAVTLYGIYENNTFRADEGGGNVEVKKSGPRFIVSEIDDDIDLYEDIELYIARASRTFVIQYIDRDYQGAQVLWLV